MAFTLTSVSPDKVSCEGGALITLTGTFEVTHRYRVHVGDITTTIDPICYSGVRGQGNVVYPTSATTLKAYVPVLTPSVTPYNILVVDLDTAEVHSLSSVLTALKKQFYSQVYSYRKVMHSSFKMGPRSIDSETPVV